MGYRSDVRIMTTQKGFKELKKYTDKYLKEKDYKYGNILDELEINENTKFAKYFGWNGIKWYDGFDDYEDINAIMDGLKYLEEKDLSYRYARIGESYDDYDEHYYESSNEEEQDLECPSMTRYFDDDYVTYNMKLNAGYQNQNIYVNCGGSLQKFNTKEEVMEFYEDCINMSEGSERERYSKIYFEVKNHLFDDQFCFTDGTDRVYMSNIDPEDIPKEDEKILRESYDIDLEELLKFKIRNKLSEHEYIYPSTLDRYEDIYDLYDNYLSDKSEHSYFYFDEDKIICIDTKVNGGDNYYEEEFPLKDYEYADKWLKGEIEYDEYLENKNNDLEV